MPRLSLYPASRYIPLFVSLLLFAVLSHYFFWQIGDDSYIYFRYVDRALAGKWWSYADYIPPVEGYSSPLWYLLLIALGKFGLGVEIASRSLGLLFATLTVLGCWQLARMLKVSIVLSGFACLFLVLNQGLHYWSSSGMESALYMALLLYACIGIVRGKYWLLPAALLAIARPEGPFLLFALTLAIAVFRRHYLSPTRLLLLWLPLACWLALRWSIYGQLLPNTFYAKATGSLSQQLSSGLMYCLPVLLPLLLLWVFWFVRKSDEQKPQLLVVLGMISMLVGIVFLGGGDWMFHFRLLLPVLALLWVAVAHYWQHSAQGSRWALALCCSLLLLLSVTPKQLVAAMSAKQLPEEHYQEGLMTQQSLVLAEQLKARYPVGTLLAVNHAGALPWALLDYDVIDMVGLNDAHIAHGEGGLHQKYDADYVLSLKPAFIVLNTRTKPGTDGIWYHPGYWVGETAVFEHADFAANYQASDWSVQWQWQIPFPYRLFVGKSDVTSWIVVYQRRTE